jgi:hypothetical protein
MQSKYSYWKMVAKIIVILLLLSLWGWGVMALYFCVSGSLWIKYLSALAFALFLPVAFILSGSFLRGSLLSFCLFVVLILWWQTLKPTNNKDWAADVAQISHGEIKGAVLTMYGVRNFEYKSEQLYYQDWETRRYDLNNLQGIDLFLSYWASEHIAHTIVSWDFGDDGHLPISIETRKDKTRSIRR